MRLGARAGLRWRPPRAHLLAPPRCAARSCARGDGEAQLYLGIDPGTKGAAVLLRADGSLCAATKLPHIGSDLDLRNLTVWLEDACAAEGTRPDQIAAAVEALGNRPSNSVRSCVTMGKNWGRIDAWLALIIGCRYDVPNPRRWQREMCPGPGDAKDRSIAACQRLVPDLDLAPGRKIKADDNLADACLLAEYARRVLGVAA